MSRIRTPAAKNRLFKRVRENEPVPTWVVVRTKRRVRTHPRKRKWRTSRLQVA